MWFDWCLEFSLHWLNICFWTSHRDYLFMTRSHMLHRIHTTPFLSLVINRMHGMVKHTNTSYHYIYILYIDYFRIVLRRNIYDIFYKKKTELFFSLFYKTQPRIKWISKKNLWTTMAERIEIIIQINGFSCNNRSRYHSE